MDISYNTFKKQVLDNLVTHLKNQYPDTSAIIPGWWPRHHVPRDHILNIEKGQMNAIKDYNLLKSVMTLPFLLSEKQLHQCAHHLNSSQIMCYNFFRPQLNDKKYVQNPLINLLKVLVGNFCCDDKPTARFEYVDKSSEEPKRKTNFDFFVEDGKTKIYFEIKYTENGFGTCDFDDRTENNDKLDNPHKTKFDKYYRGKMESCGLFKQNVIEWNKTFCNYYQLIRNAINIDENSFVIVITDKRNASTNNQIESFKTNMLIESAPYLSHLIFKTWQEMVELAHGNGFSDEHMSEFREKYLKSRDESRNCFRFSRG